MSKQNWFETLTDALNSEELIEAWDISFSPIQYGQTFRWVWEDGTRFGHLVSIYRNDRGMYERPVHYNC